MGSELQGGVASGTEGHLQDAGGGVHGVDFEEAGAGRQAFDEELRGAGFGDADAAGDFVAEGGVPVDFFEGVGFEGQQEPGFGDDEGEGGVGLVGGLGRALGVGEAVGSVVADGGDGGVGGIRGRGGVGVGEKARQTGGIGGFDGVAPRVAEAGGGGREAEVGTAPAAGDEEVGVGEGGWRAVGKVFGSRGAGAVVAQAVGAGPEFAEGEGRVAVVGVRGEGGGKAAHVGEEARGAVVGEDGRRNLRELAVRRFAEAAGALAGEFADGEMRGERQHEEDQRQLDQRETALGAGARHRSSPSWS